MAVCYHGIPELLRELNESGRALAVVTSETSALANYALEMFGIRDYFDPLVTSDDVLKRKPDPEGIHLVLRNMRLGPNECMLIGDSTDITAGREAGLLTGAATWGSETWGNAKSANPDYLFSAVEELSVFFSITQTASCGRR